MVAMGAFFSLVVVIRQHSFSLIRMPTILTFAAHKISLDDSSAKLIRSRGSSRRRSGELSAPQLLLLEIMREHQFGRVENMLVRAGQPILDRDLKVVRVACLGGESSGTKPPAGDEFELKRVICDLFDELARLGHGTVVRLEFKRGLPCRLETTPHATPGTCGSTEPQVSGS
jgi:hypothetical protein